MSFQWLMWPASGEGQRASGGASTLICLVWATGKTWASRYIFVHFSNFSMLYTTFVCLSGTNRKSSFPAFDWYVIHLVGPFLIHLLPFSWQQQSVMADSSFWHNPLPMIEAPHFNDHPPTVHTPLPIWSVVVGMFLCYTASCTCGITALLIDNVWDGLPKWIARYTQCHFWWPCHLPKHIQGHRLVTKGTGEHKTGNGRYQGPGTTGWWLFAGVLHTQKRSSRKG